MDSILSRLRAKGVLQKVVVPEHIAGLLEAFEIQPVPALSTTATSESGKVRLGTSKSIGTFSLDLHPPAADRDFAVEFTGAQGNFGGFIAAVSLNAGVAAPIFKVVPDAVGRALKPAVYKQSPTDPTEEWLEEAPGEVVLTGVDVWLVVSGQAGGVATLKFSPSKTGRALVNLQVVPPTVKLGSSEFGLELKEGLTIDLADDAVAPGRTSNGIPAAPISTPADTPTWTGIVIRKARFFLPKGVPFIGGRATDAHLQIGLSPVPGLSLSIRSQIRASGNRPAIDVLIECTDPSARGLASIVPTLVEASMELPLDTPQPVSGAGTLQFMTGKPVRARARFARKPGAGQYDYEFSLAIESHGDKGIASVDGTTLAGKAMVSAATLGTAMMTNATAGKDAGALIAFAAGGLSSFIKGGSFVVHGAEVAATGRGAPTEKMAFKIDYSVATQIQQLDVGVMSVGMAPSQPLRMRVRDLTLSINRGQPGLNMVALDYSRSTMEVEDPGRWTTSGTSLFDILGTRSGRGSIWYEIDLGFKLDLGPVKVSGATIRAEVKPNTQGLSASLSGLAALIDLPPLISGDGAVRLNSPDDFSAALSISIIPLRVSATGDVQKKNSMVKVGVGVDFPGPLPLANSGLALYSLGGLFAANGEPSVAPNAAPVDQLRWAATKPLNFSERSGAYSIGLEGVIGTAPDLGFTFSARASIVVTTPQVAVRGALDANFLGTRKTLTGSGGAAAITAMGVIVIDPAAVTLALKAEVNLPPGIDYPIVQIQVPIAAHFPIAKTATEGPSDWYIHLGSDGYPGEGRESGPVRAVLLPNLLNQSVDAYVMLRGGKISQWPRGKATSAIQGPLIALGFGFHYMFGVKPIVWAEVFARADFLLSTNPAAFFGQGEMGGKLGIGFFSIGVEAGVEFMFIEGKEPWIKARVCGTIDLFFDEISECVTLSYNDQGDFEAPDPVCPLDHEQGHWLVDDHYKPLSDDPSKPSRLGTTAAEAPTAWPDAIPLLSFATGPKLDIAATTFEGINQYPDGVSSTPLGNERLKYEWTLKDVALIDDSTNQPVSGPLSCAWQLGKFGDASEQAQPAELALLTPDPAIWLNAVTDAGQGLAHSPLDRYANGCSFEPPQARGGWAIGALARQSGDAWRLPADPVSGDPLQSQVVALVRSRTAGASHVRVEADLTLTRSVVGVHFPPPYLYEAPRCRPVPRFTHHEREFDTALVPALLRDSASARFMDIRPIAVEVTFQEPLTTAEVWLFLQADPRLVNNNGQADWRPYLALTAGAGGTPWAAARDKYYDGQGWIIQCTSAQANGLLVAVPAGVRLGVIGVWGVTATAIAAAAKRKQAASDLVAKMAGAPPTPPKNEAGSASGMTRCVLQPGSTYRIELRMEWVANWKWKGQDKTRTGSVSRTYYFKTAKAHSRTGLNLTSTAGFSYQFRKVGLFNPAMVGRYLEGYEPRQTELNWFTEDAVGVHFTHGHVAALAGVYGYDLVCTVRRLDSAENEVVPASQGPKYPRSAKFARGARKVITKAVLASPCGIRPPGMVWEAEVKLSPLAWYEVYVKAKGRQSSVEDARLGGVSFRTSRWAKPAAMLSALAAAGDGAIVGDAELAAPALRAQKVLDHDDEFEILLRNIRVDGWPTPSKPRTSHLWKSDSDAWKYVGVLIESPEPIHRPGRLEVQANGMTVEVDGATFDIQGRDRSGSRLLFATTVPFVPSPGCALRLNCMDMNLNTPVSGRIAVPPQPSFA